MKHSITPVLALLIICLCGTLKAQQVSIPLTVSDNAAIPNTRTIYFGLDPVATNGIDLSLGEEELPPFPPSGNFEARMFLPENNFSGSLSSYRDYRYGGDTSNATVEYRVRYQKQASASNITLSWNFPAGVTGQMKDVATNGAIINVAMSGAGTYTVANPAAFNAVKMFITYSLGKIDVYVKSAPQGYYNNSLQTLNMRDTMRAYLASAVAPYAFVDSATFIPDSVSLTAKVVFSNAPNGTYFLVVKGRNIIESWSREGGEMFAKGGTYSYSFDSLQTQTYGGNAVQIGTKWCFYSGDVTQDGIVDFSDLVLVDNDQYIFTAGYVPTDLTGDNFVDFSDLAMCDNNQFNFVSVVKPGTLAKKKIGQVSGQ